MISFACCAAVLIVAPTDRVRLAPVGGVWFIPTGSS